MDPVERLIDDEDESGPRRQWSAGHVQPLRRSLGRAVCDRLAIFTLDPAFRLSVVIPVFNERGTLRAVLSRLIDTGLPMQWVIVDDGSRDGSAAELAALVSEHNVRFASQTNPQVTVQLLTHAENRGKGAAIRTGIAAATGDVVVIQDADLEYNPEDFRYLLQPILTDAAEVAYGSRYTKAARVVSPWWHQTANRLITNFASICLGPRLTDIETCYKMGRRESIQTAAAACSENRFGIEIELTARLVRQKVRIAEVPIGYEHRWYDEGKKIGWKDAVSAVRCIVWYGLLRR